MTAPADGLAAVRRRYAEAMTAPLPEGGDPRLCAAFAAVPRERFLGPPPWTLLQSAAPAATVRDPAALYVDALVPLDAARGINNGSPSLHALMLHLLAPQAGERVLHAGAGSGYYSAILAELVGPAGHVAAVEYDAGLAAAARDNLAAWPQVTVACADSAAWPDGPVERIYVNFAVADLPDAWLDRLSVGGRLVLPLGVALSGARGLAASNTAHGAVLVVTRTASGFDAAFDVPVAFIGAEGATAGTVALRRALFDAFAAGDLSSVRRLVRAPVPGAWFATPRWSLCAAA